MSAGPTTRSRLPNLRAPSRIPPLENADRLTADEFERRYAAMPELKKAELIDGVVYKGGLVRDDHGRSHFDATGWLGQYWLATPSLVGSIGSMIRLGPDDRPQPDIHLRLRPECGGKATVSEDRYVVGAPELIFEIAASSATYDLHDKLLAYARNGVLEYVVWRVQDEVIDWLRLRDGEYAPLPLGDDGIIRSEVFPGLWLDPAALIDGERERVAEVARLGLASPEHAAFVAEMRRRLAAAAPTIRAEEPAS